MASRPSLEASTAEEALALGRAEHGPDANLHVREVRSGGVGGFFATRRFVADLTDPTDADGASAASGVDGPDVSSELRTVTRDHDPDLEAAIAEAAATLGNSLMTTPTRPLTAVSAERDPHASTHSPAPDSTTSSEDTSGAPVSSFAAALSRMASEPEVTSAVMDVVDGTAGRAARPHATVHTAASRVVLYSVPQASTLAATGVGEPIDRADLAEAIEDAKPVAEPVDGSVTGSSTTPALGDYNYAAMLVGGRSAFPASPTVPAAPQSVAEPVVEPVVEPVAQSAVTESTEPVAVPVARVAQPEPTAAGVVTAMVAAIPHAPDPTGLLPRLEAIGFPAHMVPDLFLHEVGEKGIHNALTRLIKMRTAPAPSLPVAPCTVVVIGPDTEALTAAMNACGALRADAAQVAWVGPAHLSNLVPASRRISTPQAATEWLAAPKRAAAVNVIAVSTAVSENIDPHIRAIVAALDPTMVLAVVDATRKAEAVTRWIEALDCVDAVALENASGTHDPATWLTFAGSPVALVEGRKATAARWASLLCERLTDLDMEA